jgi:preprotein translocase SecE subunit
MTDRKKTTGRSRTTTVRTTPKPQSNKAEATAKSVEASTGEKTEKAVKTSTRETTRREPVKQESKTTARRDTKGSTSLVKRLRNNRIGRFLYEAYYELRYKVTWPTFREARNMTLVVIALSAVVGIILAAADFGLHRLFLLIIGAQ